MLGSVKWSSTSGDATSSVPAVRLTAVLYTFSLTVLRVGEVVGKSLSSFHTQTRQS